MGSAPAFLSLSLPYGDVDGLFGPVIALVIGQSSGSSSVCNSLLLFGLLTLPNPCLVKFHMEPGVKHHLLCLSQVPYGTGYETPPVVF